MDLKDCKPGLQIIITNHIQSIPTIEVHIYGSLSSWHTYDLYNQQGIILNDRSETYNITQKTINPTTGKLYNINIVGRKVAIMLTNGDKVYLKPSEFKIMRTK